MTTARNANAPVGRGATHDAERQSSHESTSPVRAPQADLAGRVAVMTRKTSGVWVKFQSYADPAEAEAVAERLRSFGAEVALAPEDATP